MSDEIEVDDGNPEGVAHASADGLVEVALEGAASFHVPAGNVDQVVRYETPDGEKREWANPNAAPAPLTNPSPEDDVIYDGELRAYVPRLRVNVEETGGSSEHGQVG